MNKKRFLLLISLISFFISYGQKQNTQKNDSEKDKGVPYINKIYDFSIHDNFIEGRAQNATKSNYANKLMQSSVAAVAGDVPFKIRKDFNIQGDITFIANSILNRDLSRQTFTSLWTKKKVYKTPNDPYPNVYGSFSGPGKEPFQIYDSHGNRYTSWNYYINNYYYMNYIDIDNDPSTFSSSSATLKFEGKYGNCSKIKKAYLYWAATYPFKGDVANRIGRTGNDYKNIKFKAPGKGYVDVTADNVIFDDYNTGSKPYVCVADVTDKVNGSGEYTVANIRSSLGVETLVGCSAGWIMVIVYENHNETSKYISIFDGFASVSPRTSKIIDFSGFKTINNGTPKAKFIVSALEGDDLLTGDQLHIVDGPSKRIVKKLNDGVNNWHNFFNSKITKNGRFLKGKNPESINTLGFDAKLFTIQDENIIKRNQTSVSMDFNTERDLFWPFLNAMSIEVISPNIHLVKTVDDGTSDNTTNSGYKDVSGTVLQLGSEVWYDVRFQNIGNDNAKNTILEDRLPKNVGLKNIIASDKRLLEPSNYTYEPPSTSNGFRGLLRIKVPDDLVEKEDSDINWIRIKVQMDSNCEDYVDICSNKIENIAYISYDGDQSNLPRVINKPNLSDPNSCANIGTLNILADLGSCQGKVFKRTICGNSIKLQAGLGFKTYRWVKILANGTEEELKDNSGVSFGNVDNVNLVKPSLGSDLSGKYKVYKTASAANGCQKFDEIFQVVESANIANPLLDIKNIKSSTGFNFADKICARDGVKTRNFYLCGNKSTLTINLPYLKSSNNEVKWEKIRESSGYTPVKDCPELNENLWVTLNPNDKKAFSKTFNLSGNESRGFYRIEVKYNGCPKYFFFNIYRQTLAKPTIIAPPILCGKPSEIVISGLLKNGYEYKLTGPEDKAYQTSNKFTVSKAGDYVLHVRQTGSSAGSCEFKFNFNIQSQKMDLFIKKPPVITCSTSKVDVVVVERGLTLNTGLTPNTSYIYKLYLDDNDNGVYDVLIGTKNLTKKNSASFNSLSSGKYRVIVKTNDSKCEQTKDFEIKTSGNLSVNAIVTKNINCNEGIIKLSGSGGFKKPNQDYNYVLWTKKGVDLYKDLSDPNLKPYKFIPNSDFNVPLGGAGDYKFLIVDSNGCTAFSNVVTIDQEELKFKHTVIPAKCSGSKATIKVEINTIKTVLGGAISNYDFVYTTKDFGPNDINKTGVFTNLSSGTYKIKIKATEIGNKTNECIYTLNPIIIDDATSITASNATHKNISCNNKIIKMGEITFAIPTKGGKPPYEYGIKKNGDHVSSFVFSTNPIKTGLDAGIYNLRIKDKFDCYIDIDNVEIIDIFSLPKFEASIIYDCEGKGNVTISPIAGSPVLPSGVKYSIDGGNTFQNKNEFIKLMPKTYTVNIHLDNSCDETVTFTIDSNKEFTANEIANKNPSCFGQTNGSVTINVTNFGAGYKYDGYQYSKDGGTTWSTSQTTSNLIVNGLSDGNYNIQIRPAKSTLGIITASCNKTITGSLKQPSKVVVNYTFDKHVTCDVNNNNDGAAITATASGGTATGYEFELRESNGTVITSWTSNNKFVDLDATSSTSVTYKLYARDSDSCESLPVDIVIQPKKTLKIDAKVDACYNSTAKNGSITVNVLQGNGSYEFKLGVSGIWKSGNISANKFKFNNLTPNTYNIFVRDSKGCEKSIKKVLNPQLFATIDKKDVTCKGGEITIKNVIGGDSNYLYSIVVSGTTPTFSTKKSLKIPTITGTSQDYDVYVKDNNNSANACEFKKTITLNKVEDIVLNTSNVQSPVCNGDLGTIEIYFSKGTAPYKISITGPVSKTLNNVTSNKISFSSLSAGSYDITIEDANGCSKTKTVKIDELPILSFEIKPFLPKKCIGFVGNESLFGYMYVKPKVFPKLSSNQKLQFWNDKNGNFEDVNFTSETDPISGNVVDAHVVKRISPNTNVKIKFRIIDDKGTSLDKTDDLICENDLGTFKTPYPSIKGLTLNQTYDVKLCQNGIAVTLEANGGSGLYAFSINSVPNTSGVVKPTDPNGWDTGGQEIDKNGNITATNIGNNKIRYTGLIPGKSYIFYGIDLNTKCIKKNDDPLKLPPDAPKITAINNKNVCYGANKGGELSFNVDNIGGAITNSAKWTLYKVEPYPTPPSIVGTGNVSSQITGSETINNFTIKTIDAGISLNIGEYYLKTSQSNTKGVCEFASNNIEIIEKKEITGVLNKKNDITCSVNGVVMVENIKGGFGGYSITDVTLTYSGVIVPNSSLKVSGSTITIPYNVIPIIPGVKTADVKLKILDSNGCTSSELSTSISVSESPLIENVKVNSCTDNKIVTVSVVKGTPPYTFSNDNGVTFTQPVNTSKYTFNNLVNTDHFKSKTYKIIVKDANGCTSGVRDAVIYPSLDFNVNQTKELDCDVKNPQAKISIELLSGALGKYDYEINTPTKTTGSLKFDATNKKFEIFLNNSVLSSGGTYEVKLTANIPSIASYNCSEIKNVDISKKKLLKASYKIISDNICNGNNTGAFKIIADTGNEVNIVSYKISSVSGLPTGYVNTNTTGIFENLTAANDYMVEVVGDNNCTESIGPITINELAPITIKLKPVVEFSCATGNKFDPAIIEIDNIKGGKQNNSTATNATDIVRVEFWKKGIVDKKMQSGTNLIYKTTDILGGVYYVVVYDSQGCNSKSADITIKPYNKLESATAKLVVGKELSCKTDEQVRVSYTVKSGSIPSVNFSISKPSDPTFALPIKTGKEAIYDLKEGYYIFTIENPITGCKITTDYTVKPLLDYNLIIQKLSYACSGENIPTVGGNGSAKLKFSNSPKYVGAYKYTLYTGTFPSGVALRTDVAANGEVIIGNLAAGDYYVIAKYGTHNCETKPISFSVKEPAQKLKATVSVTPITCVTNDNGGVLMTATGGWGGYNFELKNLTTSTIVRSFDSNNLVNNLTKGDYQVTVKDQNNCTDVTTFKLIDPSDDPLRGKVRIKDRNKCDGKSVASIEVYDVKGGVGDTTKVRYSLTYLDKGNIKTIQKSRIFKDLPSGKYEVLISDEFSCTSVKYPIEIIDPEPVKLIINIIKNIDCVNDKATVILSGKGGDGNYKYSRDGVKYDILNTFKVPIGVNKFYIKDGNNCLSDNQIMVSPIINISASIDHVYVITCNNENNGVISVKAKGGIGKYKYSLINFVTNSVVKGPQNSEIFTDIAEGEYFIKVTSDGGCSGDTRSVKITNPKPLKLNITSEDVICHGGNDGKIKVSAVGGNGGYTYEISTDKGKFDKVKEFTDLQAGSYSISVRDKLGCKTTVNNIVIGQPQLLDINTSAITVKQQNCIGDNPPVMELDVSKIKGGTPPYYLGLNGSKPVEYTGPINLLPGKTYAVKITDSKGCNDFILPVKTVEPVYFKSSVEINPNCDKSTTLKTNYNPLYKDKLVFTLSGPENKVNDTGIFTVTTPGTYSITITHTKSCEKKINNLNVNIVDPLSFTVDKSLKNKLVINVKGGLSPYYYSYDGGLTFSTDSIVFIGQTRKYNIVVKDNRIKNKGCPVKETIPAEYIGIKIPNFFTPDGDDKNDFWYPYKIDDYNDIKVEIYDRYGRKLKSMHGIQKGWDGYYLGKPLPKGDYWYTIYYKEISGKQRKVMGNFTLYRN